MGRPTTSGGPRPTVAAGSTVTSSDTKVWAATADQLAFRTSVLNKAIKTRRNQKKPEYKSLKGKELDTVPGTKVKVAIVAAAPAGKFLAAAKQALETKRTEAKLREEQKKKGTFLHGDDSMDDDILDTLEIKISGYRSVEKEKELWLKYFGGYYKRTADKRAEFKDPHGKEAVKHMVSFISGKKAPPGFSHHTEGVSIDFFQKRKGKKKKGRKKAEKDDWVKNSTKAGKEEGRNAWWYETWIYSWLRDNAATYTFKELATEAWHYDYEK